MPNAASMAYHAQGSLYKVFELH